MDWDINFASVSQIGRRKTNQDACIAEQLTSDIYLFAVADGMGGTNGGETASSIVIQTLKEIVLQEIGELYEEPGHLRACLDLVIDTCQIKLTEAGEENEELKGMGTTLVALLIVENQYCFCSIGDSRIYRYDPSGLHQITSDHSLVQETLQKANGTEIPEDFLRRHDHIITRVLNGGNDVADVSDLYLLESDLESRLSFLLCSDGLILDKINAPNYIEESMADPKTAPIEKCNYLSNYAYEKGSNDNITIVVVDLKLITPNIQPSSEEAKSENSLATKIIR
jgi:protein phosphatase